MRVTSQVQVDAYLSHGSNLGAILVVVRGFFVRPSKLTKIIEIMGRRRRKQKTAKSKYTVETVDREYQMPMTNLCPEKALSASDLNRLHLKSLTVNFQVIY